MGGGLILPRPKWDKQFELNRNQFDFDWLAVMFNYKVTSLIDVVCTNESNVFGQDGPKQVQAFHNITSETTIAKSRVETARKMLQGDRNV